VLLEHNSNVAASERRKALADLSKLIKPFTGPDKAASSATNDYKLFIHSIGKAARLLQVQVTDDDMFNLVSSKLEGNLAQAVAALEDAGDIHDWPSLDQYLASAAAMQLQNPFTDRAPIYERFGKVHSGKSLRAFVQLISTKVPMAADVEKICMVLAAVNEPMRATIILDPVTGKFPESWASFSQYSVTKLADYSGSSNSSGDKGKQYPSGGSSSKPSSSKRKSFDSDRSTSSGKGDKRAKGAPVTCNACGQPGHAGPRSVDDKGNFICAAYDPAKNPAGQKICKRGGAKPGR
jgi:hypothetical protein